MTETTRWWNRFMAGFIIFLISMVVLFLVFLIPGVIFWAVWNWVMVGVFGLPVLSLWHTLGLLILISIVGGFFKSKDPKD